MVSKNTQEFDKVFEAVNRSEIKRFHKKDINADVILSLFEYRCLRCRRSCTTVHEIVPRSHGSNSLDPSNRVPLCDECHHNWAHRNTRASIPELQRLRVEYLHARGIDA